MVDKHRHYDPEFKKETVRLADESGKPVAEVARDLGIHRNLIYRWRKELQQGGQEAFPGQGNLPASEEEMRRLKRELEVVRQERDILKKALVFFAEESK
jgi:transposase